MSGPGILIPPGSALRARLEAIAASRRIVIFAGIPGAGKSLLVQQLALLAREAGRKVHLLQWDVARAAFETPSMLARYPEVDGFTHPVIKKAVGLWAREAVLSWHREHPGAEPLLIGEAALVGDRLIELAEPSADASEPLLSAEPTLFVLPVPSRAVRGAIEAARGATMAAPRHQRETADARPNVMRLLWEEVYREGLPAGTVRATTSPSPGSPIPYDPEVYRAVYQHWLRHRRVETLEIDELLPTHGSVYDVGVIESEIAATPQEVEAVYARLGAQ